MGGGTDSLLLLISCPMLCPVFLVGLCRHCCLRLSSVTCPLLTCTISSRCSTHSHENPFTEDGELSKKAEYILRHSTISRTELKISDPDSEKKDVVDGDIVPAQAEQTASSPQRPNDIHVKENGSAEEPLTPQSVEVEVGKASASQAEPQQAETVKLKSNKKCKCCVVQ